MGVASDSLTWVLEKVFIFYMVNVGVPRHIKDCQEVIRKIHEARRQRRLSQITNDGGGSSGDAGGGGGWRRRIVNWTVYGKDVDNWDAHGAYLLIPSFTAELVCRLALKVLRWIMIQNPPRPRPRPTPPLPSSSSSSSSKEEIGIKDFVELFENLISFLSFPRDIGVSLIIMPRLCFLYQEFQRKLKLRRDRNGSGNARLLNDNNDGDGAGHH